METSLDIGTLSRDAVKFMKRHDARKRDLEVEFPWYPWPSLTNFQHLDRLLSGGNRDLRQLIGSGTAVDIGAADGDVAFFMESLGVPMHVVDFPPTNYNSCRGVHAMREALSSNDQYVRTLVGAPSTTSTYAMEGTAPASASAPRGVLVNRTA